MLDYSSLVTVKISGYERQIVYTNLIVEQPVLDHHRFSFLWNPGGFRADAEFQLDIINKYIGQQVTIEFSNSNIFVGLITEITIDEKNNASHSFLISGYSPSYLLEDALRSCSFYKKSLQQIAQAVLQGVPGNVLKTKVAPETKDTHHYITQYNETDFQFLARMAVRYGEWFYYNGNELVFGGAGDSGATLENGIDLDRFVIKANILPHKLSYSGYDYYKGEKLSDGIKPLEAPANNSFASKAASISKDVFARENARSQHVFNVSNKQQLDQYNETDIRRIQANLVVFKGESKNKALKTGSRFKVKSSGSESEYVSINVTHFSNRSGHYQNSFTSIPSSVKSPYYTNPRAVRKSGVQTGTVKDNHDKDGLNRIKVQFPWHGGSDSTPWIRVATPHAGGGKGMHFIPEKGEEVIVDFEGGDIDKPFVLASHYHGAAKSGGGDADNNAKSLITKGGIKLVLDDSKKSLLLSDGANNSINFDGAGNIIMTSSATIKLSCGDSSIELKKDGTIEILGKKFVKLKGDNQISVLSDQDTYIKGNMKVMIMSDTQVVVDAPQVENSAKVNFKVAGALVQIEATGITDIKGATVQLNCG